MEHSGEDDPLARRNSLVVPAGYSLCAWDHKYISDIPCYLLDHADDIRLVEPPYLPSALRATTWIPSATSRTLYLPAPTALFEGVDNDEDSNGMRTFPNDFTNRQANDISHWQSNYRANFFTIRRSFAISFSSAH